MIQYDATPHYWVNHLGFLIRKELVREFTAAGHDCSAEEWAILLILDADPGLTASALAARTLRDKTTATRMVDKLVRKGLVRRAPDEVDRRVVRLHMLKAGKETFAELAAVARGLIERSVAGIPQADIDTTVSTLARMAAHLEKGSDDDL